MYLCNYRISAGMLWLQTRLNSALPIPEECPNLEAAPNTQKGARRPEDNQLPRSHQEAGYAEDAGLL